METKGVEMGKVKNRECFSWSRKRGKDFVRNELDNYREQRNNKANKSSM